MLTTRNEVAMLCHHMSKVTQNTKSGFVILPEKSQLVQLLDTQLHHKVSAEF